MSWSAVNAPSPSENVVVLLNCEEEYSVLSGLCPLAKSIVENKDAGGPSRKKGLVTREAGQGAWGGWNWDSARTALPHQLLPGETHGQSSAYTPCLHARSPLTPRLPLMQ